MLWEVVDQVVQFAAGDEDEPAAAGPRGAKRRDGRWVDLSVLGERAVEVAGQGVIAHDHRLTVGRSSTI
jgi:hypothetical protein